jgi:hypothetical protein
MVEVPVAVRIIFCSHTLAAAVADLAWLELAELIPLEQA